MSKALVILSGGQDSTTCLYWAIENYAEVGAVTFDYHQRHSAEILAAETIATRAGIKHHEVIELGSILKGNSPLTDPNKELELYNNFEEMDKLIGDRIELTFVPMRNALFLTVAANRAVVGGYNVLVTGVCQQDNANYPDCRTQFILDQEMAINSALGYGPNDKWYIDIRTPLMSLSKAESIKLAQTFPGCMEALAYSHTAYDGRYPPVSKDHASTLRAQGFLEAGVPDPLVVRAWREGLMELPNTINYINVSKD